MRKYFFMPKVIQYIEEGRLFTAAVASVLWICAALFAVAAVVAWLAAWALIFSLGGWATIGGILCQALWLVGIYMIAHVLVIRAGDIRRLEGSEYTIMPITCLLLKLTGEVLAGFSVVGGLAGGVLALFGAGVSSAASPFSVPSPLLLFTSSGHPLWSAVAMICGGVVLAVLWLVVFYLLSEMLGVMAGIARNTEGMRRAIENAWLRRATGESVLEAQTT